MTVPFQFHTPVLLPEIIAYFDVKRGQKYIDATAGGGGYTLEIVKKGGVIIGIDADKNALKHASELIQKNNFGNLVGQKIWFVHDNFKNIKKIAKTYLFDGVAAVVFDLGMSSFQLDQSGKGFTFRGDEPLDMRMSDDQGLTAEEIINSYSKEKLYEIFAHHSEELNSLAISEAIVRARAIRGKIKTTEQLKQIINSAVDLTAMRGRDARKNLDSIYARIFQALRIEVNQELQNLEIALRDSIDLLAKGGKIAVVSYHSLEDRMVKQQFRFFKQKNYIDILTKKPMTASYREIRSNHRSRSAKLRIAQKII